MNYVDKINSKLEGLDLGKPVFFLSVSPHVIRVNPNSWVPDIEENDMYDTLIKQHCNRSFSKTNKNYFIDNDLVVSRIKDDILTNTINIFLQCSPAKEPKRTKAYKSFRTILGKNRSRIDFVNSLFDINEYYQSMTKTESIKSPNNDVHRKNIYQLLCLMEKSYGKAETNSN